MNVKLERSYRSKNGNVTFVYKVTGKASELEQYKAIQGDFYRESEEGDALWFTTKCIGDTGTLIITTNGKVVPDMSAFDRANSLAEQYGGNLGQELARGAAQALLGTAPAPAATATPAPTPAPAVAEVAEETPEGDD